MEKIEDICMYFGPSRSQRKNEIDRGLGHAGTQSYEEMGCYDCDGFPKFNCEAYITLKEIEKWTMKK